MEMNVSYLSYLFIYLFWLLLISLLFSNLLLILHHQSFELNYVDEIRVHFSNEKVIDWLMRTFLLFILIIFIENNCHIITVVIN